MMMKNITLGLPRSLVMRSFDLKGSEYDREVIPKLPKGADLSRYILKDKDFDNTEKTV
jgi:1-phosphatidylinositol-4-phosphate 5-kinase